MKCRVVILALVLIFLMGMVNAQCSISNVYFTVSGEKVCAGCATESRIIYNGELGVSLVAETSGCADGTAVKFEIYQDSPSGDILRKTLDCPGGVQGGKATMEWVPEWIEDTFNNDGDDSTEYYLKACVGGDCADSTGAGVDWNLKVRSTVTEAYGSEECTFEYDEGYIRCVKIQVLDVPTWGSWWAGLGLWINMDEVYIKVTFENIDSQDHEYKLETYDATGENRVACAPWNPWSIFQITDECSTVNVGSGESYSWAMDTGKSWVSGVDDPFRHLFSYKGIVVIRLVEDGEVVEEKVIPIYYENFTIFNESNEDFRNVSDPFSYTHQLILDENCEEVGGDFSKYGFYKKQAFPDGFWGVAGSFGSSIVEFIAGRTTKSPLPICNTGGGGGQGSEQGVVDAEVWQDTETKLSPSSHYRHYLLNAKEYANFNTRKCKDKDYEENIIVHESQYRELAFEFFSDEEFYGDLRIMYLLWYEDFPKVNPLIALGLALFPPAEIVYLGVIYVATDAALSEVESMTNQIYCFKTHLMDTKECYDLNREWYALSYRNSALPPLESNYFNGTFYRSAYLEDIKKWNYDQDIVDTM